MNDEGHPKVAHETTGKVSGISIGNRADVVRDVVQLPGGEFIVITGVQPVADLSRPAARAVPMQPETRERPGDQSGAAPEVIAATRTMISRSPDRCRELAAGGAL